MKNEIKCFMLGVLSTIIVISIINFCSSYEKNVYNMLETRVSYKDEVLCMGLSSDIYGYLTHNKKSEIYFGELPQQNQAIEINAPEAILYVYPLDNNSFFVRYEPRKGIKRTYKKSGYADFNSILKAFYELTDNEVFNEIIEY